MKPMWIFVAVVVLSTGLLQPPHAAPLVATQGIRIVVANGADSSSAEQREIESLIASMVEMGQLRLIAQRDDPLVQGRTHQRFQQTYNGLPVLGADVTVQRNGVQLVSAFGIVFRGLAIDTNAQQSFSEVSSVLASRGVTVMQAAAPLSILPALDGSVALVYTVHDDQGLLSYVSASDATVLLQLNQIQTQAAVGLGTGALGDSKKISTTNQGGDFVALDSLRPPALETFDMQGNVQRATAVALGQVSPGASDLGRRPDNVWTDSAIVDAHVHAGWVYDYYYRRFQRRGLDNNDIRIHSVSHPARLQDARTAPPSVFATFYLNAFYSRNCRCVVYGEGVPAGVLSAFPGGVRNFATALDVVAHELTHAVTDASSALIYLNESGALNEAFSDIMGTSVEFFHQTPGSGILRADYLIGEDLAPSGSGLMRSMRAPVDFGQPDHFSLRRSIGATSPDFDSGGVHQNSGIANNAFYLAIEGGVHRLSRRVVSGVGAANREQVEKAFYRAFTALLPSSSTFYLARVATIQSARDLYGIGSGVERAISDAWDAVGVTSPAAALTTQFNPRSVPASAASCGGARPSFTFRVSVSEFQRVGFNVSRFSIYSFDSQARQIAVESFPATTFRSWFNECQAPSTRIAAGATACATLCGDLGGRSAGYALFEFSGIDDNGNSATFNSNILSMGLPARSDAEDTVSTPRFTKLERP